MTVSRNFVRAMKNSSDFSDGLFALSRHNFRSDENRVPSRLLLIRNVFVRLSFRDTPTALFVKMKRALTGCPGRSLECMLYLAWKKIARVAKLTLENSDVYSGGSIRCYHCTSFRP